MTFLDSITLGVVEGLTEFLPVSSTGHLILAGSLLGIPDNHFTSSFEIAIQLGAILAVLTLHLSSFLNLALLKKIVVASLPTGIIGFTLYPLVKEYLLQNEIIVITALFLGGVALIVFERRYADRQNTKELAELTYKDAFIIGCAQTLAIIPGVSRSAATILGGLGLGICRVAIVEFSFLLAVPVIAAATGLDLLKNGDSFTPREWEVLAVGFIVSFIVALVSIRWLLHHVRNHSFTAFGVYRIALSVLFAIYLFW